MTIDAMNPPAIDTLEIRKQIDIAAPIDITFQALLEELGPGGVMPGGAPFPMTLEAWPGGRWYRDLGHDAGHLWGHVQVIKPPALLEICGPLMMSHPCANHVQYRLTAHDAGHGSGNGIGTRLVLLHRAIGLIQPEHREGLPQGWAYKLECVRDLAQRHLAKGTAR